MNIGVVGLGKMGHAIAQRLLKAGHTVLGFDTNETLRTELMDLGGTAVDSIEQLCRQVSIVWVMVPVNVVDVVLENMLSALAAQSIIIDGGNSYYKDSVARAHRCALRNIAFLDCGTSGGIHGVQHGFCLMVGGSHEAYQVVMPLLSAIAAPDGVMYVGQSGTGHYVKMIHNGIEYGILQAYAEGFHLLKEGSYKDQLDLAVIANLWNHGSIIRSFILQLAHKVLQKDQDFKTVHGSIQELGTGQWTLKEAQESHIATPVLEQSLQVRAWSRATGGNYGTKFIALLRKAFGGHEFRKQE